MLYIILSLAFSAKLTWTCAEHEIAKVEEETFLNAFIPKMCFTLFFFSFYLTFLHNNSLPHNVMHFMVHHCNEKVFLSLSTCFVSSVRANEHSCNVLFGWREAKLCNFYRTLNLMGNEKVKQKLTHE